MQTEELLKEEYPHLAAEALTNMAQVLTCSCSRVGVGVPNGCRAHQCNSQGPPPPPQGRTLPLHAALMRYCREEPLGTVVKLPVIGLDDGQPCGTASHMNRLPNQLIEQANEVDFLAHPLVSA